MFFYHIFKRLLDIIYPPHCAICLDPVADPDYLCLQCFSDFKAIENIAHCQYCYYPFSSLDKNQIVADCFNCRDNKFIFKKNYSLFLFEGKVKELIYKYKYQGQDFLSKVMAVHLAAFCIKHIKAKFDLVTFVPLDTARYKERGYNQSELLAKKTAELLGDIRFKSVLKQIKKKSVQSGLPRKDRLSNVKGVFGVNNTKDISNARVLLVDDVCTTGATLNECSKVLLAKGAKEVITLSFARAVLD